MVKFYMFNHKKNKEKTKKSYTLCYLDYIDFNNIGMLMNECKCREIALK